MPLCPWVWPPVLAVPVGMPCEEAGGTERFRDVFLQLGSPGVLVVSAQHVGECSVVQ